MRFRFSFSMFRSRLGILKPTWNSWLVSDSRRIPDRPKSTRLDPNSTRVRNLQFRPGSGQPWSSSIFWFGFPYIHFRSSLDWSNTWPDPSDLHPFLFVKKKLSNFLSMYQPIHKLNHSCNSTHPTYQHVL